MNYNKLFEEDIDKNFFYNAEGYPKKILINGFIDLDKALKRLEKGEYYVLVAYQNVEELPDCYVPLSLEQQVIEVPDIKFATINPNENLLAFCENNYIQLISRMPDTLRGVRYMLGEFYLNDLIAEQLENYQNRNISHLR